MAESVCIAVPVTCRDGSAPYRLTPRLDAVDPHTLPLFGEAA